MAHDASACLSVCLPVCLSVRPSVGLTPYPISYLLCRLLRVLQEGEIYPNATAQFTVVFKPQEATVYRHMLYCDVTGQCVFAEGHTTEWTQRRACGIARDQTSICLLLLPLHTHGYH